MEIKAEKVKALAEQYKPDMTRFLRDLIKNYGESTGEKNRVYRIKEEMEKLGFDEVKIDGLGNIMGFMGHGDQLIAFDAHIDTVGIGELSNWKFDPVEGYENDCEIGGRGGSDQLGGIVSAVYGCKMMKDLGLIADDQKIMVSGTVQEEDCDGLCWL